MDFGAFASGVGQFAGGGLIGAGISSLFGNIQNNHNKNMMREQMKFQEQQRLASQEYQTGEREAMQAYQTGEREAQNIWQESMYGKYQSPEAMVRQYNEAGINGKLAASGQAGMGSMSVSGGSNGGAPSTGAPSGSHVNAPYQNIGAISAGFADIAGSLKALGEAKKLGIETKYYEDEIKERLSQSKLKTQLDSLDLDIARLYKKPAAKAALDKLMTEIEKDKMDVRVSEKQLDILVSQGVIEKAKADNIKEQIRLEQLKLSSEANEINKRAEVHVADKLLKGEQSQTERAKRSEISQNIKESNARISNIDADTLYKKALKITEQTRPALNKALTRSHNVMSSLNDLQLRLKTSTFGKEREALEAEYDKKCKELQRDIILIGSELDDLDGPRRLNEFKSIDDFYDYLARGYLELRHFNSNGPLY